MRTTVSAGIRKAAAFLDRDGTLNEDSGYVHRPEDLVLRRGVPEGAALLHRLGLPLVIVTNQGGIGLGKFTEDDMNRFHAELRTRLARAGAPVAGFYWCPHHPDSPRTELRGPCACRKPEPGLLLRASDELGLNPASSYFLGDHERDMAAARRVGATGILITYGQVPAAPSAHAVVKDFLEAARWVEASENRRRRASKGAPHG